MVFIECKLAGAVSALSKKVILWQLGAEKTSGHAFQKKVPAFLKSIAPLTILLGLKLSEIMHMIFAVCLIAISRFERSIKVHRWHLCGIFGPQISRSTIFRKMGS